MSGPEGPEWTVGAKAGSNGQATDVDNYSLTDLVLEDQPVVWPEQTPRARRSAPDAARGALIDAPGQAYRFTWVFTNETPASEMAVEFARAVPADLVPSAAGYYEALPVRDGDAGWRIIARYVEPALYPNFQTWVGEWLVPTIHRPLRGGMNWCPQWWRHSEAVTRLDALWRAWETSRLEGGASMAYWWDMHFDSHFAVLTSDRGPFAACKERTHAATDKRLDSLPCDSPPEDWIWPSDQEVRT